MSTIALRRMRMWLLFLSTINIIVLIADYSYSAAVYKQDLQLTWRDWAAIITTVILFFTYSYAYCAAPNRRLHKVLRAFLLLIPTVLLMYLSCDFLSSYLDISADWSPGERFNCMDQPDCYLNWSMIFIGLIFCCFALIEIVMTFMWGPMEKAHRYGSTQGYAQNANVIIVSPDQPHHHHQDGYYPQMQQPAQAPIFLEPLPQQTQAPILLEPLPQQQQQQQYYYPVMTGVPPQTVSPAMAPVPGTGHYSQPSVVKTSNVY